MNLFKKLFQKKEKENSINNNENKKNSAKEFPMTKTELFKNIELENDIKKQLVSNEKKIMLVQVKTYMTSHEGADAENAFKAAGITDENLRKEVLNQYTWHYLDDINENLQCTMQLVLTEVLEQSKPFTDSRHIYEQILGIKYKGFDE